MTTPIAELSYAPGYPIPNGKDFNQSPCPTSYTFSIKGAVSGDLARLDFIIESETVAVPMIAGTNTGDWTQVGPYVANGQTLVSYVAHVHTVATTETAVIDWGTDGAAPAVDCNIFPMVQRAGLGEKVQWAIVDVVALSTPSSTKVALPSITKHLPIPKGGACSYNAIGCSQNSVETISSEGIQAVTSVGHSGNVQVTALEMEQSETIAPDGTASPAGWFSAMAFIIQATPSSSDLPAIQGGHIVPVPPPPPPPPTLTLAPIPTQHLTVGVPYSYALVASGGVTLDTLPARIPFEP